jgi:hypothetical protein
MSVVRLLGFATLPCGCVVSHAHRRNQTVTPERERFASSLVSSTLRAS